MEILVSVGQVGQQRYEPQKACALRLCFMIQTRVRPFFLCLYGNAILFAFSLKRHLS
jgi:hypothetical protein